MAQRYGGQFSPTPGNKPGESPANEPGARFRGRRASRVNIAARAMFLVPLPLLFSGLGEIAGGDAVGMVVELGAFALLLISAVMLNEGLKADAAYEARAIAKPPAVPRKLFASVLTGLGVFLAAGVAPGFNLIGGVIFGVAAGCAQLLAFGFDPMKAKGGAATDDFEAERVARAIDRAEETVAEIMAAAGQIGDRRLEGRVERLIGQVREVFRTVEADPRDLTRARKFLGVYLVGARDATRKFAELYSRTRNETAREEYEALLTDLEASFRQHRQDLLADDKVSLDVEIEVLRERLQQEGV
ncbi:5-bromo-4-chloroindolyl phosphate hydrolysis family protein [Halovulum sp. GXIMD14794]